MEGILLLGAVAFIGGLIAGLVRNKVAPPTQEEIDAQWEKNRETAKKAAVFLGATATSTAYHLIKDKPNKKH